MSTQLLKGNTAVVVGALYAGSDCYFGYPITPSSEVLQEASSYFPALGRTFLQAESEEATINMVYGAAAMGHRVLTATSGPGMSLQQEGLSYMAGAELPCVIVNVMRAGPGLGGISPEQGDYNQAVKGGGHGDYHNIVLAPNSVQEMCDLTMRGFDLAVAYRNPAVILVDGAIGQMMELLTYPQKCVVPEVDLSWALSPTKETSENAVYSVNLDPERHQVLRSRLRKKYKKLEEQEVEYECYQTEDAETVLVSYGISSRISRTAVDFLRSEGARVGLFRLKTLYPFPTEALKELAEKGARRFISVEMSEGQMRDDLRLTFAQKPVDVHLISRIGGLLLTVSQVVEETQKLIKRGG